MSISQKWDLPFADLFDCTILINYYSTSNFSIHKYNGDRSVEVKIGRKEQMIKIVSM